MHFLTGKATYPSNFNEEEEEEEEEDPADDFFNYEVPSNQRRVQTQPQTASPPKKNVSFQRHAVQHSIDQIYDAEGDVRSREDVMDDIDNDTLASAQLRAEEQKNAENLGGRSSRQQLRSAGLSQPMGSTGRSPSRHDSATGRRTTRSRSPAKRSTATVTSSRDGPNPPQTTTSPAKTTLQRGRNIFIGFESTPPENLTPQEKKDNKLDGDVMNKIAIMRDCINGLCKEYLGFGDGNRVHVWLRSLKTEERRTLLNFSRAVADGGGDDKKWVEIVSDPDNRKGLGYGIIHRALVMHVFGSLLFGAPQEVLDYLERMQLQQENEDGFYRAEQRAEYITSYEIHHRMDFNETHERKFATLKLGVQIAEILRPLLDFGPYTEGRYEQMTQRLISIVSFAADFATLIRKNGNTVLYQFGNTFKGQVIDRSLVDISNIEKMIAEKEVPGSHEALTRILCAQPFYAYRKGGGVMAERILEREENQVDHSVAPELRHLPRNQVRGRLINARDGYRHKILAKAVIVGHWAEKDQSGVSLDEAVHTLEQGGCAQQ
ncbi:hypothetical protein D6D17_02897 [Aureobasidium pullulans]|uniref:Uncharacterized protein n=1 Tax=Aureobasidium pullulans TaxID=5580 RepID=A0A4S9VKA2_AURPU|nr:hypothetical protein D6D21_00032 [Aureobasidium pullulans]THX15848.1 hypothetical protein D6D17_02897 [Aureobasidium pullulans]THX66477.1 hypothetical protein D6D08_07184 [Aureobasidium pullulans]THX73364.1 hypothetical protein D6D04_08561 [Aureobasidium pullulans]THZ52473.1 hypothetical protein D6C90_01082 [Aureobasidium pullulans]